MHCIQQMHDISFKTSDCSSKLISKLFEPKFHLARTKCEAIITAVIAPMARDELHNELKKCNLLSISADTSNRCDVKLTPIVIRYLAPERTSCGKDPIFFLLKKTARSHYHTSSQQKLEHFTFGLCTNS